MPTNAASGASCTISIPRRTSSPSSSTAQAPAALHCHEYKHETNIDPTTGAIQEIVTIESQPSGPFEIIQTIAPTTYSSLTKHPMDPSPPIPSDYLISYYLDGIPIACYKQSRSMHPRAIISKVNSSDYSRTQSLQFANIKLVDPDDYEQSNDPNDGICQDEQVIKSLGTIRIDIARCFLESEPRRISHSHPVSTTNQMNFSERTKKACLSTTAGLGEPTISHASPPAFEWVVKERDPLPFLHFIFKYKPRSILENEGTIIIPQAEADEVEPKTNNNQHEGKNSNNKRVKEEDSEEIINDENKKPDLIDLDKPQPDKKPKLIDLDEPEKKPQVQQSSRVIDLTSSEEPLIKMPKFIDLTGSDNDD